MSKIGITLHAEDVVTYSVISRDADSLSRVNLTSFAIEVSTRFRETWTLVTTLNYVTNPIIGKYTFTYTIPSWDSNVTDEVRFRFKTMSSGGVLETVDKLYLYDE